MVRTSAERRDLIVWAWIGGVVGVITLGLGLWGFFWQTPAQVNREATSPVPNPGTASPVPEPTVLVAPVARTEVRLINPVEYGGQISAGYTVVDTQSGECDGSSARLGDNANAYRCTFDSNIADPCFALEGGVSVYCVPKPWTASGVKLNLTTPVNYDRAFVSPPFDREHPWPWALELVDPRVAERRWQCISSTSSGVEVAGQHVNWWCDSGEGTWEAGAAGALIVGDDPVWRVMFYFPDETELIEADVSMVWN
jgi:hypothetical protein